MIRCAILPVFLVAVLGCHRDRKPKAAAAPPAQDTTPVDLATVKTDLPPTVSDAPARRRAAPPPIPAAPPRLIAAVEREQSFSKFCYQEFGEKVDPTLTGTVAMVVTVGAGGVSDARVHGDSWSSRAGGAVNRCLDQKAADAWRPAATGIRPGTYLVRLSFRPS